jgi:Flp pilus assembly protein TadB
MRLVDAFGIGNQTQLRNQLRILDRPIERHAYEKTLGAIAGFLLPNLVTATTALAGAPLNPVIGLLAGLACGIGGFLYPDLPLGERVEARQQAFRHALSSYLDLVTIILAGGGGVESALRGAAEAGDGWAFEEIRSALRRAEFTGATPWDAFNDLGHELGVNELTELAASVGLAGGQGAKIRRSLAAKADALRAQQAAAIETNAETRTEKMIVPVTVMIIGLTLFVGFGAVEAIATDGTATTPAVAQP